MDKKKLNVAKIVSNVIENYDTYTSYLLQILEHKQAYLTCPQSLLDCIHSRHCYACTLNFVLTVKKKQFKSLPLSWPIMIGSRLDVAFRYLKMEKIYTLENIPNLLHFEQIREPADIALTCFVINGIAKQIPCYITNDVTNIHIVRDSIVRVYSYTAEGKGQELNFYTDSGQMMLRFTNGEEKSPPSDEDLRLFFKSPYPVETKRLFQFIFQQGFDIDHLGNKIALMPGHMFYRLIHKTLYASICNDDWPTVQKLHRKVIMKSIMNGDLSHIISKRTIFHKDTQVSNKTTGGNEQLREIGCNNKVFIEKRTTCYRDVNFQSYPLIPYLSQTVFFQISEKARMKNVLSFRDSHVGFLCICGTAETRNVGRQMMFARDVVVSCECPLDELYNYLQLEPSPFCSHFVVINSACIPVNKALNLRYLKEKFTTIECYVQSPFIFINYKPGIIFKRYGDIWVTPRDYPFWRDRPLTFDFITGHMMDLIPFYNHNAFAKNVLAMNALRNSILSLTPVYARYFQETVGLYCPQETPFHQEVLPAETPFSQPWVIKMPKLDVMMTSFRGLTQEDCIVMVGDDLACFDCVKAYTIKIRFFNLGKKYFWPAKDEETLLGTVVCFASHLDLQSQSINVRIEAITPHVNEIHFTKPGYKVVMHDIYDEQFLFIGIEMEYPCRDGDKLCSRAGQKGVVRRVPKGPRAAEGAVPRLLINPEAIIKRQTMGQILEMLAHGGRDYSSLLNAQDQPVHGKALIGPVFYFPVNYRSMDHLYVGNCCVRDKITGQPVRGRSRMGGMRCGFQEIKNGFQANGLSAAYCEKMLQNSDGIITDDGLAIPRSVIVVEEDAKFFKVKTDILVEPMVTECTDE